jgi:hypothetical protein
MSGLWMNAIISWVCWFWHGVSHEHELFKMWVNKSFFSWMYISQDTEIRNECTRISQTDICWNLLLSHLASWSLWGCYLWNRSKCGLTWCFISGSPGLLSSRVCFLSNLRVAQKLGDYWKLEVMFWWSICTFSVHGNGHADLFPQPVSCFDDISKPVLFFKKWTLFFLALLKNDQQVKLYIFKVYIVSFLFFGLIFRVMFRYTYILWNNYYTQAWVHLSHSLGKRKDKS